MVKVIVYDTQDVISKEYEFLLPWDKDYKDKEPRYVRFKEALKKINPETPLLIKSIRGKKL